MNTTHRFCVILLLLLKTPIAWSQTISDNGSIISNQKLRITPVFSFSDIDYDVLRSADDFSVDSEILGVEAGRGLSSKVDVAGQFQYMVNARLDNCDGKGYALGLASHFEAHKQKRSQIILNGQLTHAEQSFSCPDRAELSNGMTEIHMGGTYDFHINSQWDIFGGLRLTPFSDGSGTNKTNGGHYDFKRDSIFNVILGGSTRLAGQRLRAELILFGEMSFILGFGFDL